MFLKPEGGHSRRRMPANIKEAGGNWDMVGLVCALDSIAGKPPVKPLKRWADTEINACLKPFAPGVKSGFRQALPFLFTV